MTMRPVASVSLDLDNLWSYLKTHGDPEWEARPTYLPQFVPLALKALDELDLTITVFVVGVDAARAENADALAAISRAGHEIGNHGYSKCLRKNRWLTDLKRRFQVRQMMNRLPMRSD